ncbi:hypothetical protein ElyMa_000504200 [Elysia marginata]|uniref:Uncharacterized protein n=1 Tax=Elysia marginata TaxID=1093978 RepID=A0AAV4FX01_9GAST|nr:hypothetical protein ElyMa_000504200 [Elysia marginata]
MSEVILRSQGCCHWVVRGEDGVRNARSEMERRIEKRNLFRISAPVPATPTVLVQTMPVTILMESVLWAVRTVIGVTSVIWHVKPASTEQGVERPVMSTVLGQVTPVTTSLDIVNLAVIQDTSGENVSKNVLMVSMAKDAKISAVNIVLETEVPAIMSVVFVAWAVILDTKGLCVIKLALGVDTGQGVVRPVVSTVLEQMTSVTTRLDLVIKVVKLASSLRPVTLVRWEKVAINRAIYQCIYAR